MKTLLSAMFRFNELLAYPAHRLQSLSLVGIRLYLASVFLPAGIQKLRDWESTVFLFQYEYQVPVLAPEPAAWLGTGGEVVLSLFLVLGLLTRFSAAGLFVVNAVAVISLIDIPAAAYAQHLLWGLGLSVITLWGGGKLSVDYLIAQWSVREAGDNANATQPEGSEPILT